MVLPIGRSSLSTFVGKLKAQEKHFISLACLPPRKKRGKLVSEPNRRFISLSPKQKLGQVEPREI